MNENLDPSKNNLNADELEIDKALRPLTLSDFNGQKQVIDNLKSFIFVQAANERDKFLLIFFRITSIKRNKNIKVFSLKYY